MKAIIRDAYGSVDVLRLADIDQSVAGDADVLVRVHAAGVDQGVWHLMTGTPYVMRLAGFGIRAPKNPLLGYDVAGRVEAVGAQVTEFQTGQEVFGTCRGSFAEYAVARPDRLLSKPDNVSFEQAAAVPISGYAALQAVRQHGGVRPGQRVLIIGAGGGVGTLAVQIAKAEGAEVTGVCSGSKTELVRSVGADHVIDYTREDFADGRNRYDVILDIAGNRSLSELRRALTQRGTLVIVGGEDAGNWLGVRRQLRAAALSPFVRQKLGFFISKERRQDLEELRRLLEAGTIRPVVDRTFPLEEVPAAIRYLRDGHARGKVVITI
ncbi:MAG TPA: NAD(P)-dependent alcohol dehydrogenase [Candidatus Nitrosopolaris sp.]|nr:NAD(P)-dependent alcohol dehydrogenase [Candidatus Nitrosopolaris sp.]